jgi:ribose transport system ATP-binding protein
MENPNNPMRPVLEVKNVSKDFSGIYALKNIDLQIYPGEVTAIIGENGAGKSTLMKIISGVYTDYEGDVFMMGDKTKYRNPKEAGEQGVRRCKKQQGSCWEGSIWTLIRIPG